MQASHQKNRNTKSQLDYWIMQKMPGQNHVQQERSCKYGTKDEFVFYLFIKRRMVCTNVLHYLIAKTLDVLNNFGQADRTGVGEFYLFTGKINQDIVQPLLLQKLMNRQCTIIAMHPCNV